MKITRSIILSVLLLNSPVLHGEFQLGGDVSALATLEEHGAIFQQDGQQGDALQILADQGFNHFRLRLFVDPDHSHIVTNDLEYTLRLARRIKDSSAAFMLNFHYSDTWADPAYQTKPAAWENLSFDALVDVVEDHTYQSVLAFVREGLTPDVIQLGNEITGGMLWDDGRVNHQAKPEECNWPNLARLLKAAHRGVERATAESTMPEIMLHIESAREPDRSTWFFQSAIEHNVPFDIIGMSYYPWWHLGIDTLRTTLTALADTFDKDIYLVETTYPYRFDDLWQKDLEWMEWPMTKSGQKRFLEDIILMMRGLPDGKGKGVFWWYPESVRVPNLTGFHNGSVALFDDHGNVLPAAAVLTSERLKTDSEPRVPQATGQVRNIVFILAEDMGIQIPAYGDNTVPTPAMDRLASEGVIMENAYVTQSTCSPSRASLFTGLYPHQHGQLGLAHIYGYRLHRNTPTFVQTLNDAGYATALNYKIHVDPQRYIPFDRQIWHAEYREWGYDHADTRYMERVMNTFFDEVIAPGQPFYLQPQTSETHRPFIRKDPDVNRNVLEYLDSPYRVVTAEDVSLLPYFGPDMPELDYLLEDIAEYYNAIQRFDRAVGLVVEGLEKRGLLDETLIIVSADHGPTYGRGKLNLYQLGMHVPMIVRWPGVAPAGSRSDALVSFIDLMPTFLDIAGLPKPDYLPGRSLRGVFHSEDPWRKYLFGEYTAHTSIRHYWPSRMIRDDRYKLIWNMIAGQSAAGINPEGNPDIPASREAPEHSITDMIYKRFQHPTVFELYDLKEDPYEFHNLAQIPEYTGIVRSLHRRLIAWMEDTADPFVSRDYLREFTRDYRETETRIIAYEKEHGFDSYWGEEVTRYDYSAWVLDWKHVEEEVRKRKASAREGSF